MINTAAVLVLCSILLQENSSLSVSVSDFIFKIPHVNILKFAKKVLYFILSKFTKFNSQCWFFLYLVVWLGVSDMLLSVTSVDECPQHLLHAPVVILHFLQQLRHAIINPLLHRLPKRAQWVRNSMPGWLTDHFYFRLFAILALWLFKRVERQSAGK